MSWHNISNNLLHRNQISLRFLALDLRNRIHGHQFLTALLEGKVLLHLTTIQIGVGSRLIGHTNAALRALFLVNRSRIAEKVGGSHTLLARQVFIFHLKTLSVFHCFLVVQVETTDFWQPSLSIVHSLN